MRVLAWLDSGCVEISSARGAHLTGVKTRAGEVRFADGTGDVVYSTDTYPGSFCVRRKESPRSSMEERPTVYR